MSYTKKAGLPPGTLVHIGNKHTNETKISVIDYSAEHVQRIECKNVEDCFVYKDTESLSWINITSLNDISIIEKIGAAFNLHHLLLEDVLNTQHRPKLEDFDDYIFISLKMLGVTKDGKGIVSEQVSLVLGSTWILSFQEIEGDVFNPLRVRMENIKSAARNKHIDYLLYRILDTIVDNYFFVTENISDRFLKLEETALKASDGNTLNEIQRLKRQIIQVRKTISPLRDVVSTLQKDELEVISAETNRYIKDVYDHLIQLIDTLDTQRDLVGGIMELYLTGVSNKMNQVMQLLTIISTIFIPLTFIAGIYGMNFTYMPELQSRYGYFIVWGVMIAIFIVMIMFFKRKKWL